MPAAGLRQLCLERIPAEHHDLGVSAEAETAVGMNQRGHQAGTGTQGSARRECDRATHALVTAHDEQITVVVLVRITFARRG